METVRIRRKRKRGLRCPNNLFVLWLNEWANDAAAKGKKSQYVYQKALTSLKKYPLPLKNGAEAKILQNFGDSICKMLDRKLAEYFSKHGPEANIHYLDTPRGHRAKAVCDATKHKRSPRVKSITCSQPRRSRGEKPTKAGPSGSLPKKDVVDKKMKEYVPQKRSGGYALLITLHRSNQVGGEISLTKAELQNEAQALCDASLTVPEANSRYSAWSSMTTLIKKGLVRRSGKPARYSLTDQGAQLAERILKADQDLGLGEDSSRGLAGCCAAVAPTSTGIDNRVIDVIYIDDGENSGPSSPQRNNSRKRELVNELKRNGVAFDVRKLSVGDFLWVAKQRVRPVPGQLEVPSSLELVLDYVVERKRMDDLCGSIIDGRFREQKFRLKKCGLGNCIYLVEDHGSVQHMSIPETTLQQAIVNTQVVDGFVIKRTHDIRGSAAYLTIMTRHLQRRFSGKVLWSIPKQQKETLTSQGVREDDGHFLLNFNEFNHESAKNKAQTVREVFARQLLQFQGLSGDKAAAILEKFPTPCSLIEAFEQCHSDEERANLLSSIKFGRLQRKLGPSLAKLIAGLYCATGPLT